MHIIKRNGSESEFDPNKIIAAVTKANASVAASERIDEASVRALAERVTGRCEALNRAPSVEEVQDFVEEELQGLGAFALSRHYIRYRHARELARPLARRYAVRPACEVPLRNAAEYRAVSPAHRRALRTLHEQPIE